MKVLQLQLRVCGPEVLSYRGGGASDLELVLLRCAWIKRFDFFALGASRIILHLYLLPAIAVPQTGQSTTVNIS